MVTTPEPEPNVDERIRHRAYELWEEAGRPAGRAAEFWELARGEVEAGIA